MKGTFFDRVLGPKSGPKILQANLIVYVVFATLASQTVLAEKLKAFKKACRDASSPVLTHHQESGKNAIFLSPLHWCPFGVPK